MPDFHSKAPIQTDINSKQNLSVAILFLMGFCFLASILDSQAKYLTQTLPVVQVTWARYFFHIMFITPLVIYMHGLSAINPKGRGRQIIRGSYLLTSTLLYFLALSRIQMSETQALVFSSPLAVTILSYFLLKEKIGIHRWSAVLIGFVGVIIVINPSTENLASVGAVSAIMAGVAYGFYLVATRQLMQSPPLVTLFFTAFSGAIILTLIAPFFWQQPTAIEATLMVTLGLCGAVSHLCIIQAFRHAKASQLSPWMYAKMLFTVLWGYWLFSESPSSTTWLGAAIIISSGIYIWWREQVRKNKA